jgi:hypothetical protein
MILNNSSNASLLAKTGTVNAHVTASNIARAAVNLVEVGFK